MRTASATSRLQPTSHPRRWGRPIPRKWIRRLEPRISERRRKGTISLWTRVRRLIVAWWPWAAVCLWGLITDRWAWGIAGGGAAVVAYLMTPDEFPPVYGLDHEFGIESAEF